MNRKEKIEQEIQKTLDQFGQTEKLPENPYFYTRVQARLKEKQEQENAFFSILKPAFIIALVAINLSTAFWYLEETKQQYQTNTSQGLAEILAGDLNLNTEQNNLINLD